MPIPALAASAILGAIPALYQMGTGISQGIQARKLGKKKRPVYNIPGEITDNAALAKRSYNAASMYGMPGQGRIENKLMGSQAQAQEGILQSQQNPSAALLGLTALNQNTNNAVADLGVDAAQFRQGNMNQQQQVFMSANQALAQYRDKAFESNYMEPYKNAMNAASALRAGSISNIYGGLSSGANTAGQYINKGSKTPSTATPPISGNRIATGEANAMANASQNTLVSALKNMDVSNMTEDEIAQMLAQYGVK